MRNLTKPSTAQCTLPIYISFLLSEPKNTTCTRLSEILPISHDSVNRFLERENYTPVELWDSVKSKIVLHCGTLSVDDTVVDKPYSSPDQVELIDYFWYGKHKKSVKGLNLITLYYTDINQVGVPVNYRLVDKSSGQKKNDYFREMLSEVLIWGLQPAWITGDSWYASLDNLKGVKHHTLSFLFAVERNRLVSIEKGTYVQVQSLEVPDSGLKVYLKGFGFVKIFRTVFKEEYRYYIIHTPKHETLDYLIYDDFQIIHDNHWQIEQFHRAVKQVCHLEDFQVRKTISIRNHIFCAIRAFVQLEFLRVQNLIVNWYEVQKNLFNNVIRTFIEESVESLNGTAN